MNDSAVPASPAMPFTMATASLVKSPVFATSMSIAKIGAALAKAQASIVQPVKSADNPFFKSKYATLDVCWDAARKAFSENEIALVQAPGFDFIEVEDNGKRKRIGVVSLTSVLVHSSGEWIRNVHTAMVDQLGPQASQSALTYTRRAALCSLAMITPQDESDDDGNAAAGRNTDEASKPTAEQIGEITAAVTAAAGKGTEALKAAWEAIPAPLQPHFSKIVTALKPKAAKADKALPAAPADRAVEAPAQSA